MSTDSCGVCGGDGRIAQTSGQTSRCPACLGTGRRNDGESLFRDVTKTKPSHYRQANAVTVPEKQSWPSTFEGDKLAKEVQASSCPDETKAKLVREIIEYEGSHGSCTKTFSRKVRKQIR
jgi:DnaJ-class molecular chaperone